MTDLAKELRYSLLKYSLIVVAMLCTVVASCFTAYHRNVTGAAIIGYTLVDAVALLVATLATTAYFINRRGIIESFSSEVYNIAIESLAENKDFYFSRHGEFKELNRNHPLWYILPFHKDYFDANHYIKLTYCGENIEMCNLHAICETGNSGHFHRCDSFVGQLCKLEFTTSTFGDMYLLPKNPAIVNSINSYEKPKPRCTQPLHKYDLSGTCIANYFTVWTTNDDLVKETLTSTVMGNILDIAMSDNVTLSFVITGGNMYIALNTGVLSTYYDLDYNTAKNISVEQVTESLRGVLDRILAYKSMLSKSVNGDVIC